MAYRAYTLHAALCSLLMLFAGCSATPPPIARPPSPPAESAGDDPYKALEDGSSLDVLRYIAAEEAYTAARLKPLQRLQHRLFQEMLSRYSRQTPDVPLQIGDYEYFSRKEAGAGHASYWRRRIGTAGPSEPLLDPNILFAALPEASLRDVAFSPDQSWIAYTADVSGKENYKLFLMPMGAKSAHDLGVNFVHGIEWDAASKKIYAVTGDALRGSKLLDVNLQSGEKNILFLESDPARHLVLSRSKDGKFLFLDSQSEINSTIHALDLQIPSPKLAVVRADSTGSGGTIEHIDERFIYSAGDRRTLFVKDQNLRPTPLAEVFMRSHGGALIEDFEIFANHIVLYERIGFKSFIVVRDLQSGDEDTIEFPDEQYTLRKSINLNFKSPSFRFSLSTFTAPARTYEYNFSDRRALPVPADAGEHESRYESLMLSAPLQDGSAIPISLVYKKGLQMSAATPLLLYGYGAYGTVDFPQFDRDRQSLLDRGYIYAIAHVRGGGFGGPAWHAAGRAQFKENSISDYIRCAEFLIESGLTNPQKLVAFGRSAGGALVMASAQRRPELFGLVIGEVPFLDVVGGMSNPSHPLTQREYDEWGDARNQKSRAEMLRYSPYQNITRRQMPPLFLSASLNDQVVPFSDALKFVARTRHERPGADVLLHVSTAMPHTGPQTIEEQLREKALQFSLIIDTGSRSSS